jgi:hypothetical protein
MKKLIVLSLLLCGSLFGDCPLPNTTQFLLEKVNLSLGIVSSTTHSQSYSGEVLMLQNWSNCQRTLIDLIPSYDETKKGAGVPTITRNYDGRIQHVMYTQSQHYFTYLIVDEYHNNALGVLLRQNYGIGFGTTHKRLELDADMRAIDEQFYKPGIRNAALIGSSFKVKYSVPMKFISQHSVLALAEEFVPVYNMSKAWYSNGAGVLSIPFSTRWAFTASASDNYLRDAPYTFRRNYLKATVGIQYSLGGLLQ